MPFRLLTYFGGKMFFFPSISLPSFYLLRRRLYAIFPLIFISCNVRLIEGWKFLLDVLDDGYKWRKYEQKVVKNTQHPRLEINIIIYSSNIPFPFFFKIKSLSLFLSTIFFCFIDNHYLKHWIFIWSSCTPYNMHAYLLFSLSLLLLLLKLWWWLVGFTGMAGDFEGYWLKKPKKIFF